VRGDLTRAQSADIDTAPQSRTLAARVRRSPDVIVSRARGINLDLQPWRLLRGEMPQHALRRWAAADIAETDEKHSEGLIVQAAP
jgi:hypothetical protein